MATNKRTYPNDYFAWYNDEDRLAILSEDTQQHLAKEQKKNMIHFKALEI